MAAMLALAGSAAALDVEPIRVGIAVDVLEAEVSVTAGEIAIATADEGPDARVFRPMAPWLRFGVREAASPSPEWSVRVGTPGARRDADRVREGLAGALDVKLEVREVEGGHAVFAGPFADRGEAEAVGGRLSAAGLGEVEVTAQLPQGQDASSVRLVALTRGYELRDMPSERIVLTSTSRDGLLRLGGVTYRGELEVLVTGAGRITVVNVVGLGDYLRGVVPEELGPEVFPEPAALQAQAVAARTYALAQVHSGDHAGEGFDLCPTPHCQVYGGASAEHELADDAVAATRAMVLTWRGELATTFFSSTCGGHTEPVEAIFDAPPAPYLRGVSCYPATVSFHEIAAPPLDADWTAGGPGAEEDLLARLVAVGVVAREVAAAGGFSRRARSAEASTWLVRARRVAGLGAGDAVVLDVDTWSDLLAGLEAAWGWSGRRALLAEQDRRAAAEFSDLAGLSEKDLTRALLAWKAGVLPPAREAGWPSTRPTRGEVLEVVHGWLERRGVFDVPAERFVAARGDALLVYAGRERREVRLAPGASLLSGRREGPARARGRLRLKPGDKLRLLPAGGVAAAYVRLEEDPDGAAFDRLSSYSWWSRRTSWDDLSRRARERHGVGRLADFRVTRRSGAGRVVGVELVDRGGRAVTVRGFAVRSLLGLPDLLADVRVERGEDGRPIAVSSVGRGWGHGVGLCQTGAFGMALRGATAAEILEHYYPGTRLVPTRDARWPSDAVRPRTDG